MNKVLFLTWTSVLFAGLVLAAAQASGDHRRRQYRTTLLLCVLGLSVAVYIRYLVHAFGLWQTDEGRWILFAEAGLQGRESVLSSQVYVPLLLALYRLSGLDLLVCGHLLAVFVAACYLPALFLIYRRLAGDAGPGAHNALIVLLLSNHFIWPMVEGRPQQLGQLLVLVGALPAMRFVRSGEWRYFLPTALTILILFHYHLLSAFVFLGLLVVSWFWLDRMGGAAGTHPVSDRRPERWFAFRGDTGVADSPRSSAGPAERTPLRGLLAVVAVYVALILIEFAIQGPYLRIFHNILHHHLYNFFDRAQWIPEQRLILYAILGGAALFAARYAMPVIRGMFCRFLAWPVALPLLLSVLGLAVAWQLALIWNTADAVRWAPEQSLSHFYGRSLGWMLLFQSGNLLFIVFYLVGLRILALGGALDNFFVHASVLLSVLVVLTLVVSGLLPFGSQNLSLRLANYWVLFAAPVAARALNALPVSSHRALVTLFLVPFFAANLVLSSKDPLFFNFRLVACRDPCFTAWKEKRNSPLGQSPLPGSPASCRGETCGPFESGIRSSIHPTTWRRAVGWAERSEAHRGLATGRQGDIVDLAISFTQFAP